MEKSVFCNTHEPMHKQVLAFQGPCFIVYLFTAEFIGFLFLLGCLLGFCFFFFFFKERDELDLLSVLIH